MINSMTGFGTATSTVPTLGRVSLEIRSTNHRFLDIILHLPEGCMHWEEGLRNLISKRIKRGHVICKLEVVNLPAKNFVLNKHLLKKYYLSLTQISRQLHLKQGVSLDALMELPGIWITNSTSSLRTYWPMIKGLAEKALDRLMQKRQKEGRAIYSDLEAKLLRLNEAIKTIRVRFKKVITQRLSLFNTDEEKNSFLKSSDINEELVRLSFHLKNLTSQLRSKSERAVGKELDFILQEMQRETNTIGAKSIDALISGKVVGIKSDIEKMREQIQNIE